MQHINNQTVINEAEYEAARGDDSTTLQALPPAELHALVVKPLLCLCLHAANYNTRCTEYSGPRRRLSEYCSALKL